MLGLTHVGLIHTVISIVAVACGLAALIRHRGISPRTGIGKLYVLTTIATCLTAFGIFQHGGFGAPHALAIVTLLTLGLAAIAGNGAVFGRASRYVEAVAYSATFFFHWIPAVTETSTRLPAGAPFFANPEAPGLQAIIGALFLVFVVGATLQVRSMRRQRATSGDMRIRTMQ